MSVKRACTRKRPVSLVKQATKHSLLSRLAKLYVKPLKCFDSFLQNGSGGIDMAPTGTQATKEDLPKLDGLVIDDKAFKDGPTASASAAAAAAHVASPPPPASVEGMATSLVALDGEKERHSSGDSDDSLLSGPAGDAATKDAKIDDSRDKETAAVFLSDGTALKGILKRRKQRCFSESGVDEMSWSGSSETMSSRYSSIQEEEDDEDEDGGAHSGKKSVRFNEVVYRKVFKPNASILGLTDKNRKKKEQKRKKAARRASESDAEKPNSVGSDKSGESADENRDDEANDCEEEDSHADSGVASSVDESVPVGAARSTLDMSTKAPGKSRRARRKKLNKQAAATKQQLAMEAATDLIFDLDM
jgi:hypothetical protein